MALVWKAAHGVGIKFRAEIRQSADLDQLSGLTAFSVTGLIMV